MPKTAKKPPPQSLQKLVLNLTSPLKIEMEIELRQLAVFVGSNGVGKSLILKIAYALGSTGTLQGQVDPREGAQFVFDHTFQEQNFNGSLKALYTQGSVSVELTQGKVTKVEILNLLNPVPVRFLSSEMRTFTQMDLYLRMRKQISQEDPIAFLKAILEAYRLYDVTYVEGLILKCPFLVPEQVRKVLKSFDFEDSITSLEVDLEKCEFQAVLEDGQRKNLSTYGAGHQAILNQFIGENL